MQIDQGEGSAATVGRVMTGAYDAGFGDMNALIQAAADRPDQAPVMVYMIYNQPPFAMVSLSKGPIATIADIKGHSVGAPAGAAALKLFPLLARHAGIDPASVRVENVTPALQEQLLVRGQVDAALVFNVTTYVNLINLHVDPDKDVRWFFYGANGIDLYSNGVLVSRAMATQKPDAVRGLVRAINAGLRDAIADPDAATAAMIQAEPLLNAGLEKRRWDYALATLVRSPEEIRIGLGDVDDARMARAIVQLDEGFGLKQRPPPAQVFDRGFLPALADRSVIWHG